MKINPVDYEYMWTDYDVNFIFASCFLCKETKESDILLIYDWKSKGLRFFLSKSDKKRLSDKGVTFYDNDFTTWKERITKDIQKGKKIIEVANKEKIKIPDMTTEKIKERIIELTSLFQSINGDYFYTEFFFLDKIEELIKKYPEKYQKVIKNLEEMGKLKFQARDVLNNFSNYSKIFECYVEEVGKRTGRDDLPWLKPEDIIAILDKKKIDISNKFKVNWVLRTNDSEKVIAGENADNILNEFDNYLFNIKTDKITGTIANSGFYRGKVKVLKTFFSEKAKEEIKKVLEGDVLVAETTGPEMMIACKKAGAIVTEEGGLTSHAAIVSREFGIPCLVGCKIATRVLKDGDFIEVDANKGIVRIIKE